jgi:hypothetical protein
MSETLIKSQMIFIWKFRKRKENCDKLSSKIFLEIEFTLFRYTIFIHFINDSFD